MWYDALIIKNNKITCAKHGNKNVVVSIPPSLTASYCTKCSQEHYDAAPTCPHCGIKRGYAMGTGDCGCEVDPY